MTKQLQIVSYARPPALGFKNERAAADLRSRRSRLPPKEKAAQAPANPGWTDQAAPPLPPPSVALKGTRGAEGHALRLAGATPSKH
jgi:hypothetical protein